jgi:hypothetical protein
MATHTRQGWSRRTIRRLAPVGEAEPDHKAHGVLRNGVPDFCCDKHPFYPQDSQHIKFLVVISM